MIISEGGGGRLLSDRFESLLSWSAVRSSGRREELDELGRKLAEDLQVILKTSTEIEVSCSSWADVEWYWQGWKPHHRYRIHIAILISGVPEESAKKCAEEKSRNVEQRLSRLLAGPTLARCSVVWNLAVEVEELKK